MDPPGKPKPASGYARYVLFVLTVINVVNLWHRYLLYNLSAVSDGNCSDICDNVPFVPLCESCDLDSDTSSASVSACRQCQGCRDAYDYSYYNLKDGACIDNQEYGSLAGLGFTFMFAVAGLFAGRLSDKMDRRLLHTAAMLTWSVASAAHGACSSYHCLLVARVFVGIGEAFNAPCCYLTIAHYFPEEMRSTANGIYSTGTYLGAAVSSLCIALAKAIGWRDAAYLSGTFGVGVAAVLYLTVQQPQQAPPPRRPAPPLALKAAGLELSVPALPELGCVPTLKAIFSSPTVCLLMLATSVRMIGVWVIASYLPLYYKRAFPSLNGLYSVLNAFVITIGGVVSSFMGGYIADRFANRWPGCLAWLPAAGALLGMVPMGVALYSKSFYTSILALFVEYLVAECWLGPGMTILQREVPRSMAGIGVACLLFLNTSISTVGPLLIAANDPGTAAVRWQIMAQMCFSYGASAVLFVVLGFMLQLRASRGPAHPPAFDYQPVSGLWQGQDIEQLSVITEPLGSSGASSDGSPDSSRRQSLSEAQLSAGQNLSRAATPLGPGVLLSNLKGQTASYLPEPVCEPHHRMGRRAQDSGHQYESLSDHLSGRWPPDTLSI